MEECSLPSWARRNRSTMTPSFPTSVSAKAVILRKYLLKDQAECLPAVKDEIQIGAGGLESADQRVWVEPRFDGFDKISRATFQRRREIETAESDVARASTQRVRARPATHRVCSPFRGSRAGQVALCGRRYVLPFSSCSPQRIQASPLIAPKDVTAHWTLPQSQQTPWCRV